MDTTEHEPIPASHRRLTLISDADRAPASREAPSIEVAHDVRDVPVVLSSEERKIALALARVALPAHAGLRGADEHTIAKFETWLTAYPGHVRRAFQLGLRAFDLSTVLTRGRRFVSLSAEDQAAILAAREQSPRFVERFALRMLLTPIKWVHFDSPEMFAHVGCPHGVAPVKDDKPRWMSQVTDGRTVTEDLTLECEVVVVGTGAGGAAAAYELARKGRAVLMLEEGDYHRRGAFNGKVAHANQNFYRDKGIIASIGNVAAGVWAGRAVGGSTVVNSGTCYRTPPEVFDRWRRDFGLPSDFSEQGMAPYFERVESMLGVAPLDPMLAGEIANIIARGSDRLGYSHKTLSRNAPGCDGQGVCCFGCPTGAKRSTDVSYVPEALLRGAQLLTAAHVDRVLIHRGRATGVTGTLRTHGGVSRRFTVKADAVVVAGGTLLTPLILRRSGACRTSGELGKNLSIHPATKAMALFDGRVDPWRGVPQSYTIDQFASEGILFEGASSPLDVAAMGTPWSGKRLMELMAQYPHLATFGFLVADTSRGQVREGPGGSPILMYSLNEQDTAKMQRGLEILIEVFQAAGARKVMPFIYGHEEVSTKQALESLRRSRLKAGDFEVTGFHPLGTCRIGMDPRSSCIGPDHEAHDVGNLYVCDGSAIPSSLGRNPQITIMATALRAAEIIDSRLC